MKLLNIDLILIGRSEHFQSFFPSVLSNYLVNYCYVVRTLCSLF